MKKQREAHWVDVRDHYQKVWKKRIAVDLECNPVLCVDPDDHEKYLNFEAYDIIKWEKWREIKEPEYVPYETMEECFEDLKKDQFMVKRKECNFFTAIIYIDGSGGVTYNDNFSFNELLDNYTKLDGTPCGKLKEEK